MIDEIKNRISIEQLLSYLGIRPNRSNFIHSIYKQEKTASLKIYPATNTYFCFATDTGGDVIKFYADYHKIEVKQSIKELAEVFGIENNYNKNKQSDETINLVKYSINDQYKLLESEKELFDEKAAVSQFDKKLDRTTSEKLAFETILINRKIIQSKIYEAVYQFCKSKGIDENIYSYLTGTQRGLNDNSISEFKIFNIHSVKDTIDFLKDNFTKDEIRISGFFKNKYFLFTKHRLIIPYIENGKIVYLRGRYFYEGNFKPDNFGKYIGLNNWTLTLSPKRFYNVDILKKMRAFEDLIITEGEFDAIITNQTGLYAIGVPGVSNFPQNQINIIKYYNNYLAFDSDEAGQKAIDKISMLFDRPINVIKLKVHKDLTEYFNAK